MTLRLPFHTASGHQCPCLTTTQKDVGEAVYDWCFHCLEWRHDPTARWETCLKLKNECMDPKFDWQILTLMTCHALSGMQDPWIFLLIWIKTDAHVCTIYTYVRRSWRSWVLDFVVFIQLPWKHGTKSRLKPSQYPYLWLCRTGMISTIRSILTVKKGPQLRMDLFGRKHVCVLQKLQGFWLSVAMPVSQGCRTLWLTVAMPVS